MEIEIKTEADMSNMASKMMEKIVMFLNKYGAKPETVQSLIKEVTPNIEKYKEEKTEDKMEEKPEEKMEEKTEKKELTGPSLQERLLSMCK